MNWLDLVFIAVLTLSTISSLRKGFSREIIALAAAVFALLFAMWFYGVAGWYLRDYVDSTRVANLLGFLLVVAGVLVAGMLVSFLVNRFIRTAGLTFFDRLLGAAFGFARGALVLMALLTAFMAFGAHAGTDNTPSAVVHSKLAPCVLDASRLAVAMAPSDLKRNFQKYYYKVKSAVAVRATGRDEKEF